jgi:hypothetical protein
VATISNPAGLAVELIAEHGATVARNGHHGVVARYLAGDHDLPYMPREHRAEYEIMAMRSVTNLLPRVSDTFVKLLFLDGYADTGAKDNSPAWDYWQANKLDARQTITHRGAIEYGASYVLVLPGDKSPVIRPLDPLRSMAWYEDEDDEWPQYGLRHRGKDSTGAAIWELIDDVAVYTVVGTDGAYRLVSTEEHGLGVTPMVRFRDRLDGKPTGIIKPLIIVQDRVNDTVFALTMAMHFAAFRQRWATGLAIPVDENTTISIPNPSYDPNGSTDPEVNPATIDVPNPNYGQPIETFQAAVDRLWVTDQQTATFGEFNQTHVDGHLSALDAAIETLATLGQLPSGTLKGNLINVSAEALASLYDVTKRQGDVYKLLFGEAWEQVFALAAVAAGDEPDDGAQVRWRDTDARSFAAVVDALGKMVQMLDVPHEAAWEMIPEVTDQDIARWRKMDQNGDGLAALTAALTKQTTLAKAATTAVDTAEGVNPGAPPAPASTPSPAPAAGKAK